MTSTTIARRRTFNIPDGYPYEQCRTEGHTWVRPPHGIIPERLAAPLCPSYCRPLYRHCGSCKSWKRRVVSEVTGLYWVQGSLMLYPEHYLKGVFPYLLDLDGEERPPPAEWRLHTILSEPTDYLLEPCEA